MPLPDINDPTTDFSFAGPSLPTSVPAPAPEPQATGWHRALQVAIPLIAAAFAAKHGGFGGFGEGYGQSALAIEKMQQQKREQDLARSIQAEGLRVRQDAERRQNQRDALLAADRAQAEKDRQAAFQEKQLKDKQASYRQTVDAMLRAPRSVLNDEILNDENGPAKVSVSPGVTLRDVFTTLNVPFVRDKTGAGRWMYDIKQDEGPLYDVNENGKGVFRNRKEAEGKQKFVPPPQVTDSFTKPDELLDDKGLPTGQFGPTFNTKTGTWGPTKGAPPGGHTKALPGAAADRKVESEMGEARKAFNLLDKQIDRADELKILGPLGGTVADLLGQRLGTTGDPEKDYAITRLGGLLNTAKLKADLVLTHTVRGAASPNLAKRWDNLLKMRLSKAGLKGALSALQDMAAEADNGTEPKTPPAAGRDLGKDWGSQ